MSFVVGYPSVDDLIIRITDCQRSARQQIACNVGLVYVKYRRVLHNDGGIVEFYPIIVGFHIYLIFNIDKLDEDETVQQVQAASALARELREVVIPEVDTYTYDKMCSLAGTKPTAKALTAENIYDEILAASQTLDDAEVPETDRVLVVTPATYQLMKKSKDIILETDIGEDMRLRGVIGNLDGMSVQKVPANRLPEKFGFMVAHPSATVGPVKLEDYKIHTDTIYSSGAVVTGRICYDAFVLDNKKTSIYYQATT